MQCRQKQTPQTSPNVSKPDDGVQVQDEEIEKLCSLLISENASSPPGQKLVVGKNPILPLFDIANTPFASKHPQVIWRGIITRGKERICLQGHHFYRTTWTLCAK